MKDALLVTANSPGEIAGWLRPIAEEWARAHPERGIVVVMLPCNFATGHEAGIATELPGVRKVVPVSSLFRFFLYEGAAYRGGTLLHLGGDQMYAAALSWRYDLRSFAYLWGRPWWDRLFQGYFTKNDWGVQWLRKRRIPQSKIHLVGDLMVDSVYQKAEVSTPDPLQLSFFPGSREQELANLAPFFLETAEVLAAGRPELRFKLHLSPFLPQDQLEGLLQSAPHPKMGGVQGRLNGNSLAGPHGARLELVQADSLKVLSRSSLAISIPGTKTGEAGSLGVPTLTLLPLNRPELLPALGPLALLDYLPGGAWLKGRFLLRTKPTLGFISQPNILAQEEIMPEMVDPLTPVQVAGRVEQILGDTRLLERARRRNLELFSSLAGAAAKIVATL